MAAILRTLFSLPAIASCNCLHLFLPLPIATGAALMPGTFLSQPPVQDPVTWLVSAAGQGQTVILAEEARIECTCLQAVSQGEKSSSFYAHPQEGATGQKLFDPVLLLHDPRRLWMKQENIYLKRCAILLNTA